MSDYSIVVPDDFVTQSAQDLMKSLSDKSQRQYLHTFLMWGDFCRDNRIPISAITPRNVTWFLEGDIAHSTKQARLSHLRNLLRAMHANQPDNADIESLMKRIEFVKITRTDEEKDSTETHIALTPAQVNKVFEVFDTDRKLHIRNRAMMAVLFYCGLRRDELVSLKWSDINLDEEMLTVRHGKGDKPRTVPILGGIGYIRAWFNISIGRTWFMCGFWKGDRMKKDKPVTTNVVWRTIKQVAEKLDIESLSPHDARRTLITTLLNNGVSLPDAQFIAGHKKAETTMIYAKVKGANEVKLRVKGKLTY